MIGVFVQVRVRIKIRFRVRVGVMFNILAFTIGAVVAGANVVHSNFQVT